MAESTGVEKRVSEPEPTLKASSVDSKYSVQALSLLAEVRNHINQKKFIHWKNGSVSDHCIYGILHKFTFAWKGYLVIIRPADKRIF